MVCMDVNFADPSGDYGEAGTGLVLIPASDEDVNGSVHSRPALIRGGRERLLGGLERGPRHADVRGRRGPRPGRRPHRRQPVHVVVADVPIGSGKTLYARFGDWFAWLCGLVAVAGIVVGARKPSLSPITTNSGQL